MAYFAMFEKLPAITQIALIIAVVVILRSPIAVERIRKILMIVCNLNPSQQKGKATARRNGPPAVKKPLV